MDSVFQRRVWRWAKEVTGENRSCRAWVHGQHPFAGVRENRAQLGLALPRAAPLASAEDRQPSDPAARRVLGEVRRQPGSRDDLAARLGLDAPALAAVLLALELDGWLRNPDSWSDEDLLAAWSSRCPMLGQRLVVRHEGRVHGGSVVDVDPTAELVIRLDGGDVRTFRAADTSVNKASPV